jgi:hypothetical protein
MSDEVRMTWAHIVREDARREFAALARRVRYSKAYREWWLRGFVWRIEGWLLAWTTDAEPCDDYRGRLLAEDDNGDWLVPAADRNGEPYWRGYWRWWRPDHWPVYLRSWRRRTYVMVEEEPW